MPNANAIFSIFLSSLLGKSTGKLSKFRVIDYCMSQNRLWIVGFRNFLIYVSNNSIYGSLLPFFPPNPLYIYRCNQIYYSCCLWTSLRPLLSSPSSSSPPPNLAIYISDRKLTFIDLGQNFCSLKFCFVSL